MKKTLLYLFVTITTLSFAQAPQGVSYQAVAFDASGNAIVNGSVGVQVSVLDNSATGTAVYIETHTETTNAQGLFNLNIGQGAATSGTFSGINWATNSKFLKVEVDPTGGTTYTTAGITELMSVPYALFAENVNLSNVPSASGIVNLSDLEGASVAFEDYTDDKFYAFSNNVWTSQPHSGSTSSLDEVNGNFSFEDYTDDKFYVFNYTSNNWVGQTHTGSTSSLSTDSLGNFFFEDYTDDKFYVFSRITNQWASQIHSGSTSSISNSNGLFTFEDYTDDKFYIFNTRSGLWASQTHSGSTSSITSIGGVFTFEDYTNDIFYVFDLNNSTWFPQAHSGSTSSIKFSIITGE